MFSLKEIFRNVLARHEAAREQKAQAAQVIDAIAREDLSRVQDILLQTRFDDQKQRDDMLAAAIRSDNPSIFETVLDKVADGNRNYTLGDEYSVMLESSTYVHALPLLSYAIAEGSSLVAWTLASDEKTDIAATGKTNQYVHAVGGYYGIATTCIESTHKTPLELARNAGMNDVAAVLASREAALKREQALRLDATAMNLRK
ncbi:MAG: hypothetical protein HYU57_08320 [Micavibrio aeruginosavorus]|nr:hypothetical protein [Micavibrio aeruginosavorus]